MHRCLNQSSPGKIMNKRVKNYKCTYICRGSQLIYDASLAYNHVNYK